MNVSLSFGNVVHCKLDESRILKMMEGDEKQATYVNLWQQIKDLFRTDKKSDAYKELYNLLHSTKGVDKLDIFNKLKSFANPECQNLFTKEIYCDEVVFSIGDKKIAQNSIQGLIGISEQTPLYSMSRQEQRVFLEMLDTLREKEALFSDHRPSYIKKLISNEHCYDLLYLYRPQEDIEYPGFECQHTEFLDYKENNLLKRLNKASMKFKGQYSCMGYQKTSSGVEFSMVHPSISFLLNSYARNDAEFSSIMEFNTVFLKELNQGYADYQQQKSEVDRILKKVYDAHGETLSISYKGVNNNKLVNSPFVDIPYISQMDDFSYNLNHSLDAIFNKWSGSKVRPS